MLVPSVATLENISPAGFSGRGDSDSSPATYQPEPLPTQIAYSSTRLSYDSEIRRLFFQYRDTETGEIQREIPSREAMKVYEQREQRREEARQVDTTDEAAATGAGTGSRQLEAQVISAEPASQQRAATSAPVAESEGEGPPADAGSSRGIATDQLV